MSKCDKCRYSAPMNIGEDKEMLRGCLYILHKARRRPCKPGKDCTVFEHKNKLKEG